MTLPILAYPESLLLGALKNARRSKWASLALVVILCSSLQAKPVKQPAPFMGTTATLTNERATSRSRWYLEGETSSTSFRWEFENDPTGPVPGMTYYPEAVYLSDRPERVWIESYYHYQGGITLFDVTTGKGVLGYRGFNHQVSPNGKHVIYDTTHNHFHIFTVAIDNVIIYPAKPQIAPPSLSTMEVTGVERKSEYKWPSDFPGVSNHRLEDLRWLNDQSVAFLVHEERGSEDDEAEIGNDIWYYYRANGITTNVDPAKITVSRARVPNSLIHKYLKARRSLADFDIWNEFRKLNGEFTPYTPPLPQAPERAPR